jgi:hypothetical protein
MEKQRFIGIGTSWIVLIIRCDVKNCPNNNDHIENVGHIYEMDVRDDEKSMGMSSTNFGHVQGI